MTECEPTTRTMNISDVKKELSLLASQVFRKETRILIEKSGNPVAALVSTDDLVRLEQLERDWEDGTRALERFSKAFADVPVAELEARIAQIIAEGRAHDAEERFAVIDRMREAFADVPPEEIEREAERSLAAARARRRQRSREAAARSA